MEQRKITQEDLIKIHNALYEVPQSFRSDMRVPARIFVNQELLDEIMHDTSIQQIINVSTLPGIQKWALVMPDIHQGYGFPIGGVAAFDINEGGIISPGGIGYDINCGVRLLTASLPYEEIKPYLEQLATEIFNTVPSGVGRGGKIKLDLSELEKLLATGSKYMLEKGYGEPHDLELCEEGGSMADADPKHVSEKAKNRGRDQVGTLGSGNHFLELQVVDKIYDKAVAELFGLQEGMVTIMIHCGSRGLGHQVCTDYVRMMLPKLESWNITLPDKELACAPFSSPDAQNYYSAMCAAANFAWANRHTIGHWVRQAFEKVIGPSVSLRTVYDLSHNMGKKETHTIDGVDKKLIMHRKGATRSFGPGRPEVPAKYRAVGHPVLIPGTMGTSSYVLVGTETGMQTSFGSCCHGAGRRMSRMKAKKAVSGRNLRDELAAQGIIIRCESDRGLAEEAPLAYKDVDVVVRVVEEAQIAQRVARVKPIAVIKGG